MAVKEHIIKEILDAPEKALPYVNLVYTKDANFTISRKSDQNRFVYLKGKRPLVDPDQIERIKKLVIPPAWQNVRITHLENGHLQAIGRDQRKRRQYRYHELWTKIRNQTKFYRMADFGKNLSRIRAAVEKGLQETEWSQTKVVALVIKIMDETHIRIGNVQYAKRNKTYGLATLRKKHVVHNQNKLRFEFLGKRGKKHRVTLKNKRLVRLIRQCEEIPGWELFQFYDEEGNKRNVDSRMVNEFLHGITDEHFTAKDFRTWSATTIFYETLRQFESEGEVKDKDKMILRAYDAAAEALGNTRNVCRKYYVHPEIVNQYHEGFSSLSQDKSSFSKSELINLTDSEEEVLHIIENYEPNLKEEI